MKQKLHAVLITLVMCLLGLGGATAQTTYTINWSNAKSADAGTQTPDGSKFFTAAGDAPNTSYSGTYGGVSYSKGLKLNSKGSIKFTTTAKATVTLVQAPKVSKGTTSNYTVGTNDPAIDATVPTNHVDYATDATGDIKGVRVWTASVEAGDHTIALGTKQKELGLIFVQVDQEASTQPVLSLSPDTLELNAIPAFPSIEKTFNLSAENLAAGTYNLTVPDVEGLTVTPLSFTIDATGKASEAITVKYAPTNDAAAATAQITATVGELSETVTINYSAKLTAYEQKTVSEATTWDFSKTGLTADINAIDEPTLYANLGATVSDDFAADAITYTGAYPFIEKVTCRTQEDNLAFKTSVAGTVTVTFSSANTKDSRTLKVNGKTTSYSATGDQVTSDPIAVPAGDVTIGGSAWIKIYKVVFTPSAALSDVTLSVGNEGYATLYYSDRALTVPANAKAYTYKITQNETGDVLSQSQAYDAGSVIPAGTAVVVSAEAGNYTFAASATGGTVDEANVLRGSDEAATTEGGTIYYMFANGSKGVGFYWGADNGAAFQNGAHKAYIAYNPQNVANAKSFLDIEGGSTTGINTIKTDVAKDGSQSIYNLSGQRVDKSYKGIVISNGHKYINK